MLSGLIALGIQKGSNVIVPAYICESTIRPLQAYGFGLIFVDIDRQLEFPVDIIKKIIINDSSIKALLVVHYFGFTKDIEKVVTVCQEYDVKVVEDASHSFLSQYFRGFDYIKADVEIFSMRKSFPVVDGGMLKINKGGHNLVHEECNRCVSMESECRYLVLRLVEKVVTMVGVNIYGQYINKIKRKYRSKERSRELHLNTKSCQPSWLLGKYLGNEKFLSDIQSKVLGNFNQLSGSLQKLGFDLLVESVEGALSPQACVIYDERGGLVEYLRSRGIGAWQWPGEEMPEEVIEDLERYPNAISFDKKLVLIPIHQSLNDRDISYIISCLELFNNIEKREK